RAAYLINSRSGSVTQSHPVKLTRHTELRRRFIKWASRPRKLGPGAQVVRSFQGARRPAQLKKTIHRLLRESARLRRHAHHIDCRTQGVEYAQIVDDCGSETAERIRGDDAAQPPFHIHPGKCAEGAGAGYFLNKLGGGILCQYPAPMTVIRALAVWIGKRRPHGVVFGQVLGLVGKPFLDRAAREIERTIVAKAIAQDHPLEFLVTGRCGTSATSNAWIHRP